MAGGYHPKVIKDYDMLKQKIEYIHYNPVRRNLVIKPEDWNYSSAKYYIKGEDCGLKITSMRYNSFIFLSFSSPSLGTR